MIKLWNEMKNKETNEIHRYGKVNEGTKQHTMKTKLFEREGLRRITVDARNDKEINQRKSEI